MWTPRRIVLMLVGLAGLLGVYFVYTRFLGGVDGLPELPAAYLLLARSVTVLATGTRKAALAVLVVAALLAHLLVHMRYYEVPAKDNQWFVLEVIVQGKHVVTKVDGKVIVDYTEPENAVAPKGHPGRLISHGTFAIQGHDPGSKILYKRIEVKPLP